MNKNILILTYTIHVFLFANERLKISPKWEHNSERELNKATNDIPSENLKRLQVEIMHMKQQNMATIQSEQHRSYLAEEQNKTLAAMHE